MAKWLDSALDLKSVSGGFKSHSDGELIDVVHRSPKFNFFGMLVNSQLVCLPSAGILNQLS